MIRYSLKCQNEHTFDSWFQSASAFDKLQDTKMVTCAICGSTEIEKAIMAPQVRPDRINKKPAVTDRPLSGPASAAEQAIAEMRKKIEDTSENVGTDFAKEARAIHNGDAPARSIYGEAKIKEAKELADDGIDVTPLPWRDRRNSN